MFPPAAIPLVHAAQQKPGAVHVSAALLAVHVVDGVPGTVPPWRSLLLMILSALPTTP